MTDQPAECTPACSEQHTYQLSTCALACTERYGGVADPSWAVPCPRCKARADRPCTRWDGSAASVACQKRWDLFDQKALAARQAQSEPGYCPHCGRGDCAPTPNDYEQAHRRAVRIQTLLDDTRDRVRKLHRPAHYGGRIVCAECSADAALRRCPDC